MITTDIGNGRCMCGRLIETTAGNFPQIAQYIDRECIYALCSHGIVVIDKREKEKKKTRRESCKKNIMTD